MCVHSSRFLTRLRSNPSPFRASPPHAPRRQVHGLEVGIESKPRLVCFSLLGSHKFLCTTACLLARGREGSRRHQILRAVQEPSGGRAHNYMLRSGAWFVLLSSLGECSYEGWTLAVDSDQDQKSNSHLICVTSPMRTICKTHLFNSIRCGPSLGYPSYR
jgi:hypothetical protein